MSVVDEDLPSSEVLLEDHLLKKGTRGRWHRRYFRFTSDNRFEYFGEKGDRKPRVTHAISDLNDVEVSMPFVKHHHKQVLYCLKISWSTVSDDRSNQVDDESSVGSRSEAAPNSPGSPTDDLIERPDNDALRKSPFRVRPKLRRSKTENDAVPSPTCNSFDEANMFGIRRRRTPANELADEIPNIPELVDFDSYPAQGNGESLAATPVANRRINLSKYEEGQLQEKEILQAQYLSAKKISKRKARRKMANGTKLVAAAGTAVGVTIVTAGVGLIGGLVALGVGAAAGGGGAMADMAWGKKRVSAIVIASSEYKTLCRWKACLDAAVNSSSIQSSRWGQLFVSDGRKTRDALFPNSQRSLDANIDNGSDSKSKRKHERLSESKVRWTPLEAGWTSALGTGTQGIRIQREERVTIDDNGTEVPDALVDDHPCAPLKSQIVLATTPVDAFLCLMSSGRIMEADSISEIVPNSGQSASFRVIERVDNHTDVIHLVFKPLFLFPAWTKQRDFVLYRYWRVEEDGSYFICFESSDHVSCPPTADYVRGEMHQVFTIAPPRRSSDRCSESSRTECLMTAVVQVDPKGWVPTKSLSLFANQSYAEGFAVAALLQLLDVKDAIDTDRFVAVDGESSQPRGKRKLYEIPFANEIPLGIPRATSMEDDPLNYDFKYSRHESLKVHTSATGFVSNPTPWDEERWAEPDADAFRVRGANYLQDRQKVNAGMSIGRLVAVDVVNVDEPLYTGLTTHPKERLQLALTKEKRLREIGKESDLPPFIFAMNIVMPGPPVYHAVFWYAVDDMSTIDGSDGTPSSQLCNRFFFGPSDDFRDSTFKLIPQIVQGNFIVRKAVGSKPAIMGKKLQQYYIRTNRSFEIVLDCGSSQVATGVIRLSLGYAQTLAVDMGFVFEADEDKVLPERVFGAVRCKQPVFGPHLRKVEPPGDHR